ncbi:MAG: STAS domain-containing protein [Armatimonadota bacterium]
MDNDLMIDVRKDDKIAIIELAGEVDAYTSSKFKEVMIEQIESGSSHLIVNMENVEYIDSAGLGALVGGLKRASEHNGKIVVVCSKPQIKKVFEITGLERVFPIFNDEVSAKSAAEETHRPTV